MRKLLIFMVVISFTAFLSGQKPADFLLKGKAFIDAGRSADAINILTEGLQSFKESSLYLQRAEAYMLRGEYSQALGDLNSANKLEPSSGEYGLARIYGLKGDAATAVYHLEANLKSPFKKSEKEIMLDPSFSTIENRTEWRQFWQKEWYGIAERGVSEIEYYISTGNTGEARSVLSGLTGEYPGDNRIIYAGALLSFAESKYPEAIKAVTDLLNEDPDNVKYLRLLATTQEAGGNQAGASTTYTKLLNLGVPDAELLLRRAECFRKTGETGKALEDVSKYLDLYPADKKALSFAGKVESASGDNIKALDFFSQNLKLHPNDAQCYVDRANSYFLSGSWNWAIKDYSMSLDLQPENSEAWLNKGISLLNSGNANDACHDFRKAFNLGNKKATELISRNCIK